MPTFPLPFRPAESYHECPRAFRCPRDGGKRLHAGCDLWVPIGTPVHACVAGKIHGSYPFYLGTWAVEIKAEDGSIIRYGEVQRPALFPLGQPVEQGQQIALVGQCEGINEAMLHFEMYAGTMYGPLTSNFATDVTSFTFKRRGDLIDPTEFLDDCILKSTGLTT
jgi:murein DD-endopeptidase MepM/ murein hydrolase activator NlpD